MWFIENYEDRASLGIKADGKIVDEQSPYQRIEIYETPYFGKLLTLDGFAMLSEKGEFVYHEMMAHPALCSHPDPKQVLVIGGGDGGVVREVLKHTSVQRVVLCEIDERVTRVCQEYLPTVASSLNDSRVDLVFQDGFDYLNQFKDTFDVIITDSTDPIGPAAKLFKETYYRLVKKALKPDGIMISQSESAWLYEDILKGMTREICLVFKHVKTYRAEVPVYPPGFMITFGSDQHRLENFDRKRSTNLSESCRYYDSDIHLSALVLPKFARELVYNQSE
jgi:spermidine synthase